jgi:hypothetical protein
LHDDGLLRLIPKSCMITNEKMKASDPCKIKVTPALFMPPSFWKVRLHHPSRFPAG